MLDMDYVFNYLRNLGLSFKSLAHLGANHAQSRNVYIKNGINKILWIEAIPELANKLKRSLESDIDLVYEGVLSNRSGDKVNFNISSNNSMSSSIFDFKKHSEQYPTIKMIDSVELITTTLDDLMKNNSVIYDYDIAVLDLQGAELKTLQGASCLLKRSFAVICEVSSIELYENAPLENEVDLFMSENGFNKEIVAYTEYGWGEALYLRRENLNFK